MSIRTCGAYSGGWLCFESEGEKRRLTPVPDEWERAGADALGGWLAGAIAVHPDRRGDARHANPQTGS